MKYVDILKLTKKNAPLQANQILANKRTRFEYLQSLYEDHKDLSVLPEARELKKEIQALT